MTCVSVTLSRAAILARSFSDKYFFCSNCFSNSKICLPVKVVRAFFFLSEPVDDGSEAAPELVPDGLEAMAPEAAVVAAARWTGEHSGSTPSTGMCESSWLCSRTAERFAHEPPDVAVHKKRCFNLIAHVNFNIDID